MPLSYTVNVHGDAGYAHGCRCDTCGVGRLEAQRERRARQPGAYRRRKYAERASKYKNADDVPTSSPEMISAWKEVLYG